VENYVNARLLPGRIRYWLIKNKVILAFRSCHVKGNRTTNTTFKIETIIEKYLRTKKKKSAELSDVLWMLRKQSVEKRLLV
jgi:hypothetical protein